MTTQTINTVIELSSRNYVPVVNDSITYYGGSQMWFPDSHKYSKDYVLHYYGCGTIATADLFLYLAMQNEAFQSPETNIALGGNISINYINYDAYVRIINNQYTKTRRFLAVLGPKIAWAINAYSKNYNLGYRADWKWSLSYYDMLELISEMLDNNIPVILSIGPNTPKLWGKKGISFYEKYEINLSGNSTKEESRVKLYGYNPVKQDINSHYVTVTALIKDNIANKIMLRISSWGKQFYIDFEEYRNYIEELGGTFTSSLVYINKF